MSPAPRQSPRGRTGVPHRGGPRGRPWHPPHELRDAGPDPAAAAQGAPRRATAGGRNRAATIGQRLGRARPTNADRRPRPTPRGDSPTTGLVPPIINMFTNINVNPSRRRRASPARPNGLRATAQPLSKPHHISPNHSTPHTQQHARVNHM